MKKFGTTQLKLPHGLLGYLEENLLVTSNEVMFLNPDMHKGIIPKLLQEILDARIMVKQSMKRVKDNKVCGTRS